MPKLSRHFPAEWAPQQAVMLTWPHDQTDWAETLDAAESVFVNIAQAVCRYENLIAVCRDAEHLEHVRQALRRAGIAEDRYSLWISPSNDTWARDHGPISVYAEGRRELLDFTFNGWGNKFQARLDNQITANLHGAGAFGDSPRREMALVLEGGSLESDGQGTVLTTEHCLLSPQRNPQLDRAGIEAALREWLGAERVLWLRHGALEGDDTDSHIDTLARFCDAATIAYVQCTDPADSHYADLREMERELQAFRQPNGDPYRLLPLPWPQAKYDAEGQRMPATYANFLIINGAVLVPTYDDPADKVALEILAGAFAGREIIGIPCLPLIQQHGSLHCVTMQVPR